MTGIIGAMLTMGGCTAAGFCAAAQKRRRALCAEGFAALVAHIQSQLPSLVLLEDIIASFENTALERAGVMEVLKSQNSLMPCNKRLLAAIELQTEDKALYSLLLPVARELGSTCYERQLQSLTAATAGLNELCATRRKGLAETERCYRWLGALTGAAAVILLI